MVVVALAEGEKGDFLGLGCLICNIKAARWIVC